MRALTSYIAVDEQAAERMRAAWERWQQHLGEEEETLLFVSKRMTHPSYRSSFPASPPAICCLRTRSTTPSGSIGEQSSAALLSQKRPANAGVGDRRVPVAHGFEAAIGDAQTSADNIIDDACHHP